MALILVVALVARASKAAPQDRLAGRKVGTRLLLDDADHGNEGDLIVAADRIGCNRRRPRQRRSRLPAALCELMNEDDSMMRGDALVVFSRKHGYPMLTTREAGRVPA